jgi:hypothetical protein
MAICDDPEPGDGLTSDRPGIVSTLETPGFDGRGTVLAVGEDCPFEKPPCGEGFAMGPIRDADGADARKLPCWGILLTTGRLNARELGAAARIPDFGPSLASRVGFAPTRFNLGAFRIALCDT